MRISNSREVRSNKGFPLNEAHNNKSFKCTTAYSQLCSELVRMKLIPILSEVAQNYEIH